MQTKDLLIETNNQVNEKYLFGKREAHETS